MSGLVSYSYDPSSEQELSDASNEYKQEKKAQTENQRKPDLDRERRREDGRYEESRNRERERDPGYRRDREERPTHRRHHKHRKHRHSSSDSESPERERRPHRRSPNRRSRSPRHRDRPHRARRDRTPPRAITSARSPPGDTRSDRHNSRQDGVGVTPEEKVEMALTAMNSGGTVQPGNPYGMSREKFRNLQSKKKMLWSKDEEEDSAVKNTGSVYITATNSLPVNQEKKDKFSKMMGLKSPLDSQSPTLPTPDLVRYDQTQDDLQKQYDASRVHTHIMKGSGLGYGNYYQV